MAFSQSDMLQKEVYLFERLDAIRSNERMKHLKCLVFIRPTKNNIAQLCHELRNPRFGSYFICKCSIHSPPIAPKGIFFLTSWTTNGIF